MGTKQIKILSLLLVFAMISISAWAQDVPKAPVPHLDVLLKFMDDFNAINDMAALRDKEIKDLFYVMLIDLEFDLDLVGLFRERTPQLLKHSFKKTDLENNCSRRLSTPLSQGPRELDHVEYFCYVPMVNRDNGHFLGFVTLGLAQGRWSFLAPIPDYVPREGDDYDEDVIEARADAFFDAIRKRQWEDLPGFTVIAAKQHDEATRKRMGILEGDAKNEIANKIRIFIKNAYGSSKPGKVVSISRVRDHNGFPIRNLTRVTYEYLYRYESSRLDKITMRYIDGQWYYTLE